MPNALAQETSPYLRQHAENPVDWLPWGPVALARARERDKPLLVSIGYSACHWCHVMERESFEDPRTASVMNDSFVCVKVDREERPDIDALYMEAVQGMTGHGGWPLNVFLTPEQLPFYGGTYFPPDARHGMPAWTQVLQAIAESWEHNREEIRAGGERLRERLSGGARLSPSSDPPGERALEQAVASLAESFDARHGGFGGAPKFPQAPVLELLLARGERTMSLTTLHAMAGGGIHDQIGGGFARYSVDASWTVPHFEKMLYDNALLARAYLHGWQASRGAGDAPGAQPAQATGDARLLDVCRDTLDWALREMRGPEGGFYSALDADSEGVEGRFYVWTVAELDDVLGEDAAAAIAWLGATEQGNFQDPHHPEPGLNVLTDRGDGRIPDHQTRERIRERLLAARERRERPALDDKRLTSWNALMICALADAGAALDEPRYLDAAIACAEFLQGQMRDDRGRLLRTYNHGQARIDGYLEDHAFLLEALLALFEASCEERWLHQAIALAGEIIERFADPQHGGFFSTAADAEALIVRRKDLEDSPIPSGSSSAAVGLLRLAQLTGDDRYERQALGALALVADIAPRHPTAFGHMLQALHWHLSPARPIACAVPANRFDESAHGVGD
ncbi:MAG TPA: thioredoxin domain-containing protein [Solirubrobacteraceae bacterium]|nr:thioredoxin domain-containing protein [Solirubrobacteraceae bacterium]